MEYYPNASNADQSAVTSGCTQAIVTAIGTAKTATIRFKHNKSGNTTSYAFASNVTIPANVVIIIDEGALIAPATGVTVTFNGPVLIGDYKAFSLTGTGKVVLSEKTMPEIKSVWWGDTGDGVTDDYAALQAALTTLSTMPGTKLISGPGSHLLSAGLVWTGDYTEFVCQGFLMANFTSASTALTIGESGRQNVGMKGQVYVKDNKGSVWATAKTGIAVRSVNDGVLSLAAGGTGGAGEGGFANGIIVSGDNNSDGLTGDSTSYSKFYLGVVRDNKIGLKVTQGTLGWANENVFYGGHFTGGTGAAADPKSSGSAHIWNERASGSAHGANNNRFEYPSFESDNYEYYFYTNSGSSALLVPRMEGTPVYKVFVDTGGDDFRYWPGYSGTFWDPTTGFVSIAALGPTVVGRYQTSVGSTIIRSIATAPASGYTYKAGDLAFHSDAAYGEWAIKYCTSSGTFSAATDATGDTDGSTAAITGLTDTSDFYTGEYVTVSAGMPSASTPYRIIAKTSTSVTLDTNSDSAQSNVTVATVDPVFVTLTNALTTDTVQAASYAAELNIDLQNGDVAYIASAITGDIKIMNPTNAKVGQRFMVALTCDGTGRAITYDTKYQAGTSTVTANKKIVLEFVVLTTSVIRQVGTPLEI